MEILETKTTQRKLRKTIEIRKDLYGEQKCENTRKTCEKCSKRGNSEKSKLTESKRVGGRYWRGCSEKKRSEERREEELASSYAEEKDGDAWDAIYILENHILTCTRRFAPACP